MVADDQRWILHIYAMEPRNKEREPQDLIKGSNENKAILSEDAMRQLSKSLTVLIPNKNVDSLKEDAFAYGLWCHVEEDY